MSTERGSTAPGGTTAEPVSAPSGGAGARTVAHVDLRPTGGDAPLDPDGGASRRSGRPSLGRALTNLEQTVRADDRVCPYGVSRIAIAFGPDADAVAPRVLGERLARAVGQGLVGERPARRRPPAGHLPAPPRGRDHAERPGERGRIRPPRSAPSPRPPWSPWSACWTAARRRHDLVPLALRPPDPGSPVPRLRHRTVIRYSTRRLAGYGTRHDDHRPNGDHGRWAPSWWWTPTRPPPARRVWPRWPPPPWPSAWATGPG